MMDFASIMICSAVRLLIKYFVNKGAFSSVMIIHLLMSNIIFVKEGQSLVMVRI
jgi:hypothetical protein